MKTPLGRLGIALVAAAPLVLQGCALESSVQVRSVHSPVVDAPALPVSVYSRIDDTTANIYLTDLQASALDAGTPLDGISGRIVHLHMFLLPDAGSTPIETSACSVTVRHIVIAGGEVGIYGGGGFLKPRRQIAGDSIQGQIRSATLRLTASTPNFADRLGPANMNATIAARRDEAAAKRIGQRLEDILALALPAGGEAQSSR
jgi:hypothetical protein